MRRIGLDRLFGSFARRLTAALFRTADHILLNELPSSVGKPLRREAAEILSDERSRLIDRLRMVVIIETLIGLWVPFAAMRWLFVTLRRMPSAPSSASTLKLILFWIPRRHREVILGDLLEEVELYRSEGWSEWKLTIYISVQVLWVFAEMVWKGIRPLIIPVVQLIAQFSK